MSRIEQRRQEMTNDDDRVFVPNAYTDVVVITYYPRRADADSGDWQPSRVVDRPIVAWAFNSNEGLEGWDSGLAAELRPIALGPRTLFRENECASAYYERSTGLVFTFDGEVFGSVDEWIATNPVRFSD